MGSVEGIVDRFASEIKIYFCLDEILKLLQVTNTECLGCMLSLLKMKRYLYIRDVILFSQASSENVAVSVS